MHFFFCFYFDSMTSFLIRKAGSISILSRYFFRNIDNASILCSSTFSAPFYKVPWIPRDRYSSARSPCRTSPHSACTSPGNVAQTLPVGWPLGCTACTTLADSCRKQGDFRQTTQIWLPATPERGRWRDAVVVVETLAGWWILSWWWRGKGFVNAGWSKGYRRLSDRSMTDVLVSFRVERWYFVRAWKEINQIRRCINSSRNDIENIEILLLTYSSFNTPRLYVKTYNLVAKHLYLL